MFVCVCMCVYVGVWACVCVRVPVRVYSDIFTHKKRRYSWELFKKLHEIGVHSDFNLHLGQAMWKFCVLKNCIFIFESNQVVFCNRVGGGRISSHTLHYITPFIASREHTLQVAGMVWDSGNHRTTPPPPRQPPKGASAFLHLHTIT